MLSFQMIDCHQFLSYENKVARVVFRPIKDDIIEVAVNDRYGTRIVLPVNNSFISTADTYDEYKHDMCVYLKDNLTIVTAEANSNRIGQFLRLLFKIEGTVYKISDIQYMV